MSASVLHARELFEFTVPAAQLFYTVDTPLPIVAMFHDLHVSWPGAGADAVRELQRTVAFLDECTQKRCSCVDVKR